MPERWLGPSLGTASEPPTERRTVWAIRGGLRRPRVVADRGPGRVPRLEFLPPAPGSTSSAMKLPRPHDLRVVHVASGAITLLAGDQQIGAVGGFSPEVGSGPLLAGGLRRQGGAMDRRCRWLRCAAPGLRHVFRRLAAVAARVSVPRHSRRSEGQGRRNSRRSVRPVRHGQRHAPGRPAAATGAPEPDRRVGHPSVERDRAAGELPDETHRPSGRPTRARSRSPASTSSQWCVVEEVLTTTSNDASGNGSAAARCRPGTSAEVWGSVVRRGSRGRALDHPGIEVHAGDVERVAIRQLECQLAGPAAHVEDPWRPVGRAPHPERRSA